MPNPRVTERLRLVPLGPADLPLIVRLDAPEEVRRYVDAPVPPTPDEALAWLRRVDETYGDTPLGFWRVDLLATGEPIGWVHLRPERREGPARLELGYRLLPEFWGQGYAPEASRDLLRLAGELGESEVIATVLEANLPSRRVLEKLGFRLVESYRYDGRLPALLYSRAIA